MLLERRHGQQTKHQWGDTSSAAGPSGAVRICWNPPNTSTLDYSKYMYGNIETVILIWPKPYKHKARGAVTPCTVQLSLPGGRDFSGWVHWVCGHAVDVGLLLSQCMLGYMQQGLTLMRIRQAGREMSESDQWTLDSRWYWVMFTIE